MKKSIYILLVILIIITGIALPYFLIFNGFQFSEESIEWANWGSYFGGTLSPILSFITILILLSNMREEQRNNEESKRNQLTTEYLHCINKLDDSISTKIHTYKNHLPPNMERLDAKKNSRTSGSQPIIWEFVDNLILYKKFINKLYLLDPNHPIIEYTIYKYGKYITLLESLYYFTWNNV